MVRYSKQREAILRVLKDTTSHPTADWIYKQVRKEVPNISLGTVYRNLKLLKQEGKILELDFAGTPRRFDGNTHDPYHFRCKQCGRIFDVTEPVHKGIKINKRIALEVGLKFTCSRLEFEGLCKDCQLKGLT